MIQDLRFKNKTKKKLGFSLVELLVVVVIIMILTGIGSYSISRFTQTKDVTEAKDYLVDKIKLARNLSITNQLPDRSLELKYVKVSILDGKLMVEGIKNDGTGTTAPPYFVENINNGKIDTNIALATESSAVNSFGFSGKNGRLTDGEGNLFDGPLVIKISNRYGSFGLKISDLGIINNE